MWTRAELKTRAKYLFRMNYWKAVLAALVLSILAGGGSSAFSGSGLSSFSSGLSSAGTSYSYNFNSTLKPDNIYEMPDRGNMYDALSEPASGQVPPAVSLMFAGMVTVILLIIAAVAIAVDILLLNPLEVGVRRFFTQNLYAKAQIRELAFGFDHSYKNVIHVMFFRDLYTFLWSLLFIIPGIVKSYEYRMIPYLLAEYPDMPKEDAFAISKYMMSGNKWKTFVLDLSFILWFLGSAFTLGLLGLFYGDPYYAQTAAALYDALKAEKHPFTPQPIPGPQQNRPADPMYPPQQNFSAGQPYPQGQVPAAGQPYPREQYSADAQPDLQQEDTAGEKPDDNAEMDKPAQQDYNTDQE